MNPFALLTNGIVALVRTAPLLTLLLGIVMFVALCIFNWVPKYRKVANYYLSGMQKDETQAFATAQGTLYGINGIVVFISGLLILFSLIALGIG